MTLAALIQLVIVWLPILIILVVVWVFARTQMREYRSHVAKVTAINTEIHEISRKSQEIAQAQLDVLKQIKSLLEDRNT